MLTDISKRLCRSGTLPAVGSQHQLLWRVVGPVVC